MKVLAPLLVSMSLLITPVQAQQVDSGCITSDKFITDFKTGLGAPVNITKYDLETTVKILMIFHKDFGIDISKIDPKKVAGSIWIKSERFPNGVVMLLTADKDSRVSCYSGVFSMKIYKYAVDKLGLTEI